MKISIIAAIGPNRELGRDNQLLWYIPADMKHFRELTKGHAVIMGQKTYLSLGKALPNRVNVILNREPDFKADGCEIFSSIAEAQVYLEKLIKEKKIPEEVFIIGGGQIYKQFLPLADRLYLTLVTPPNGRGGFEADTFFPEYASLFKKTVSSQTGESNGFNYTFVELIKQLL
jgi:dihydrofolate reductase